MSTVVDIDTLRINYLTQAQYDALISGGTVEEDEIYLTPSSVSTVIQAQGSGSVSLAASTITQVPLVSSTALYNNTNDAEVDQTLGGIKIKTAGLYKVQGGIYISTSSTTTMYGVYLYKSTNSGNYASASECYGGLANARASSWHAAVTPAVLISCNANDVVYLAGRSLGGTATIAADNHSTLLAVERVG
jgi:hypothetical protein